MPMEREDRDLLVRIDEQMKAMRSSFDEERRAVSGRLANRDQEMADLKDQVENLRISRAQIIGYAGGLAFAISLLIKLFWK